MKIIETLPPDPYDGQWSLKLQAMGKVHYLQFGRGEPEDMCLARDLSDAFHIKDLLLLAYEAGKAGEPLEDTVYLKEDDDLG